MAETFGHKVMDDDRIANGIRFQAEHCRRNDAPITARIVEAQLALIDKATAVGQRIASWPGLPLEDAMPLRLAGGFHHLHLTKVDNRLGAIYNGTISDQTDVDALIVAIAADHSTRLLPWFDTPPQTNEAGRSASFMAGLKWLSGKVGSRFELNELGASAGINTMMERYHYDLGGVMAGPPDSPMQIKPEWRGAPPPDHPVEIVEISGCDQQVIDLSDTEAALRVKSYVWPENKLRLQRMDAAIRLAMDEPPHLTQADALDWVLERLNTPQSSGVTRVFNHSIVWQYIPANKRQKITDAIEAAGTRATTQKPLAWMMLETNRETFRHELRIRHWPASPEWTLLGQAQAHGSWVEWYRDGSAR